MPRYAFRGDWTFPRLCYELLRLYEVPRDGSWKGADDEVGGGCQGEGAVLVGESEMKL